VPTTVVLTDVPTLATGFLAHPSPPVGAVLVTTLGVIQHFTVGFHFPDIIIANGLSVISIKLTDTTLATFDPTAANKCNENCALPALVASQPGTTLTRCNGDLYQASGCLPASCIAGAVTNGTMLCYLTPTTPVMIGGGLFLNPLTMGNFTLFNETCANTTTIFDLNRTVTGGLEEGWKIFFIVAISILSLVVLVVVILLINNRASAVKSPSGAMGMGQGGYPNPRAMPYQMNMNNSNMGMMSSQYGRGMGY
jgi:hypothetical protein